MDLSKIPFFDLINKRLTWLAQRQDLLAQNVANADTPGYKARDLKEPTFAELVRGAGNPGVPVATQRGHFGAQVRGAHWTAVDDTSGTPTMNGNTVDMENELIKVSKTGIDYQFAINLYRKQIGMIKTALGRGGAG
ncbi:MAG: flagellar basal body rod protein FlgB [Gemmatimonas sp.]